MKIRQLYLFNSYTFLNIRLLFIIVMFLLSQLSRTSIVVERGLLNYFYEILFTYVNYKNNNSFQYYTFYRFYIFSIINLKFLSTLYSMSPKYLHDHLRGHTAFHSSLFTISCCLLVTSFLCSGIFFFIYILVSSQNT